jgi:glycosyltransferase involved in cell wall biosynthesis
VKIAYVGPFDFPSSNANSLRVRGMVDALLIAGHNVQVCAFTSHAKDMIPDFDLESVDVKYTDEYGKGVFSGVHAGLRGLFLGDNTLHWLQSLEQKPDMIILYGTHLGYLWRLLAFCKQHNIRLLLDVVEWYNPRHLPGGVFGPFAISNELSMRLFAKKADGMFVISQYLQDYFTDQGCKTLRVPPLFLTQDIRPAQFRESNGRLNLCYVGSLGKKEDFISIFQGLEIAYEAGCVFTMHVVGITASQFQQSYGMEDLSVFRSDNTIQFYGRVDNTEAKRIVASCDFLVLLRKNERFAQAGFPSKVAESLCLGTPVIANLTSDLADYLEDGENGIIAESSNAEAFSVAISRANGISSQELDVMSKAALRVAGQKFSASKRSSAIDEFVKHVYLEG